MLKLPWNKPWDLEGLFWQPGDENQRFYGSVRHEPENGTRLHLVGSSLMDPEGRRPPPSLVDALHGQATDGVLLSLLNVYPTRWTGGATSTLDAFCDTIVAGHSHLTDLDTADVRRVTLDLHGLRQTLVGTWPHGGGILAPREVPGGTTRSSGSGSRPRCSVGG